MKGNVIFSKIALSSSAPPPKKKSTNKPHSQIIHFLYYFFWKGKSKKRKNLNLKNFLYKIEKIFSEENRRSRAFIK
jgi:hypothetical protein